MTTSRGVKPPPLIKRDRQNVKPRDVILLDHLVEGIVPRGWVSDLKSKPQTSGLYRVIKTVTVKNTIVYGVVWFTVMPKITESYWNEKPGEKVYGWKAI